MRFIKSNAKLFVGALFAALIIVAYLSSYNLPEWWDGAGLLFELFYQFSIAYCISYLFFILQVYVPESNNQRKAFEVIKEDLSALSYDLLDIVFLVENCACLENNVIIFNKGCYYFKRLECGEPHKGGYANKIEISTHSFEALQESINKRITRITNNSLYSQNSFEIIESSSVLQSLRFFDALIFTCAANSQHTYIATENVKRDFLEFKRVANILWKLTHSSEQMPVELSDGEIAMYHKQMGKAPKLPGKARMFIGGNEDGVNTKFTANKTDE